MHYIYSWRVYNRSGYQQVEAFGLSPQHDIMETSSRSDLLCSARLNHASAIFRPIPSDANAFPMHIVVKAYKGYVCMCVFMIWNQFFKRNGIDCCITCRKMAVAPESLTSQQAMCRTQEQIEMHVEPTHSQPMREVKQS